MLERALTKALMRGGGRARPAGQQAGAGPGERDREGSAGAHLTTYE